MPKIFTIVRPKTEKQLLKDRIKRWEEENSKSLAEMTMRLHDTCLRFLKEANENSDENNETNWENTVSDSKLSKTIKSAIKDSIIELINYTSGYTAEKSKSAAQEWNYTIDGIKSLMSALSGISNEHGDILSKQLIKAGYSPVFNDLFPALRYALRFSRRNRTNYEGRGNRRSNISFFTMALTKNIEFGIRRKLKRSFEIASGRLPEWFGNNENSAIQTSLVPVFSHPDPMLIFLMVREFDEGATIKQVQSALKSMPAKG